MSELISRIKSTFDKDYDPEKDPNYKEPTNENASPSMLNRFQTFIKKKTSDISQIIKKNNPDVDHYKSHIDAILKYYNAQYTRDNTNEINQKLTTELQQFKDIETIYLRELEFYVEHHDLNQTEAYQHAHNILDTFLEDRGVSRDMHGNVVEPDNNMLGGSYKKTKKHRRPLQKKTRRVKKRKTKATRKCRKSRK